MKCNKCGNLIDADSKFCPYCGEKVEPAVKSQNKAVIIFASICAVLVFSLGIAFSMMLTKSNTVPENEETELRKETVNDGTQMGSFYTVEYTLKHLSDLAAKSDEEDPYRIRVGGYISSKEFNSQYRTWSCYIVNEKDKVLSGKLTGEALKDEEQKRIKNRECIHVSFPKTEVLNADTGDFITVEGVLEYGFGPKGLSYIAINSTSIIR